MLGELSFGSFLLTGDTVSGSSLSDQNRELKERVSVFSLIIKGLGAHISQDFDQALVFYSLASDPQLWSNSTGLEVVNLLAGNASLRQTQILIDDANDMDSTTQKLVDRP